MPQGESSYVKLSSNTKGFTSTACPLLTGIKAGNVVYVSGTLALDKKGKQVGANDLRAQTRHVLETIKSVIEAAGGTLAEVTFNAIFLKDLSDYGKMNEAWNQGRGFLF